MLPGPQVRRFGDLFSSVEPLRLRGAEREVSGITDDSRLVRPGWAFVAVRGRCHDGHRFVPEALARGAVAVVTEREVPLPEDVAWAQVASTRRALGPLALSFHGHPERRLTLLAVTGTNGKTSVAWFLWKALNRLGRQTGLLGTIFYDLWERTIPAPATTPPAARLASFLAEMSARGASHAVLEVSSHALDQERVGGLRFRAAAFTNLSRDHLDYHGTLEDYYRAKRRLFTEHLGDEGVAVVNVADAWGRRLAGELRPRVLRVGEELRGKVVERDAGGFVFEVTHGDWAFTLRTGLVGDFQLENLLVAVGLALSLGLDLEEILAALEGVTAPRGRLELVARVSGAAVFVDYAHTPEALRRALASLRPLARGRLWVLFGCGGERDRGKRPQMGRVAEEGADRVVLTSDNPRREDPLAIIEDIRRGLRGEPALVEPDRRRAIAAVLERLSPGDVLLVAGKGHEDYQEVGGQRFPFSDEEVIQELVWTEAA